MCRKIVFTMFAFKIKVNFIHNGVEVIVVAAHKPFNVIVKLKVLHKWLASYIHLCLCAYLCLSVCAYASLDIHTYVHIHMYIYVCMYCVCVVAFLDMQYFAIFIAYTYYHLANN